MNRPPGCRRSGSPVSETSVHRRRRTHTARTISLMIAHRRNVSGKIGSSPAESPGIPDRPRRPVGGWAPCLRGVGPEVRAQVVPRERRSAVEAPSAQRSDNSRALGFGVHREARVGATSRVSLRHVTDELCRRRERGSAVDAHLRHGVRLHRKQLPARSPFVCPCPTVGPKSPIDGPHRRRSPRLSNQRGRRGGRSRREEKPTKTQGSRACADRVKLDGRASRPLGRAPQSGMIPHSNDEQYEGQQQDDNDNDRKRRERSILLQNLIHLRLDP